MLMEIPGLLAIEKMKHSSLEIQSLLIPIFILFLKMDILVLFATCFIIMGKKIKPL